MAVDRFFMLKNKSVSRQLFMPTTFFKSLCATDDWKPAREVKTSSDSIRFVHGQISHKQFAVNRLWSLSSLFHLD